MERKTFEFEIKELNEEGKFSGYLSTFGNVDAGNDMVDAGAFKKTLREKKGFPLNWGHQPNHPDLVVGSFTGEEDEKGLKIDGGFFLDLEGGKKAYLTAKKLFEKKIKMGLSMGYRTMKYVYETINGVMIRHLKEVKLREGALTLFPMNEEAHLDAIKEDADVTDTEQKPYPNEHACRVQDPGKYIRFARMKRKHNGKEYFAIIGFKKGGGSEDQAYRYPKDTWSASEASSHCKEYDGTFEAAKKDKDLEFKCTSCGQAFELSEPGVKLTPKDEPPDKDEPEVHSALKKIAKGLKTITGGTN